MAEISKAKQVGAVAQADEVGKLAAEAKPNGAAPPPAIAAGERVAIATLNPADVAKAVAAAAEDPAVPHTTDPVAAKLTIPADAAKVAAPAAASSAFGTAARLAFPASAAGAVTAKVFDAGVVLGGRSMAAAGNPVLDAVAQRISTIHPGDLAKTTSMGTNEPFLTLGRLVSQATRLGGGRAAIARIRGAGPVMGPAYLTPAIGLAMSGGGAKGDFEVGAARYLYENNFFSFRTGPARPDVVTGTSVGAVNAVKLAEDLGVGALEDVWLTQLRRDSDMWTDHITWALDALQHDLAEAEFGAAETVGGLAATMFINPIAGLPVFFGGISVLAETIAAVTGTIERLLAQRSLFDIEPIARRSRAEEQWWGPLGPGLRGSSLVFATAASGAQFCVARGYDDVVYIAPVTLVAGQRGLGAWRSLAVTSNADPEIVGAAGAASALMIRLSADNRYYTLLIDHALNTSYPTGPAQWASLGYPMLPNPETCADPNPDGTCPPIREDWNSFTSAPAALPLTDAAGHACHLVIARDVNARVHTKILAADFETPFWYADGDEHGGEALAPDISTGTFHSGVGVVVTRRGDGVMVQQRFRGAAAPAYCTRLSRGWEALPGRANSRVTLVAAGDGRLVAACRGTDNGGYVMVESGAADGGWSGTWHPLGGVLTSDLAMAPAGDGLLIVARGTDLAYYSNLVTNLDTGAASGWRRLAPPDGGDFLTDPVLVTEPEGVWLIGVAADRRAYSCLRTSSFSRWTRLPGTFYAGIQMRVAMVALEDAELRHVDEAGRFVEHSDEPLVTRTDGVVASASIPAFFPAVALNGKTYVDGGCRSTTPIKAALDAGAVTVFALVASPPVPDPGRDPLTGATITDYALENFVNVGARAALDVMPDSIMESELAPETPWQQDVVIIQPTVAVHDALTIDPALIRINHAYGWMRAADVCNAVDVAQAMYTSDNIISARTGAYALEGSLRGAAGALGRAALFGGLRTLKRGVAQWVAQRRANGDPLPPDADQWALQWEGSAPAGLPASPWDAATVGGVVFPADHP